MQTTEVISNGHSRQGNDPGDVEAPVRVGVLDHLHVQVSRGSLLRPDTKQGSTPGPTPNGCGASFSENLACSPAEPPLFSAPADAPALLPTGDPPADRESTSSSLDPDRVSKEQKLPEETSDERGVPWRCWIFVCDVRPCAPRMLPAHQCWRRVGHVRCRGVRARVEGFVRVAHVPPPLESPCVCPSAGKVRGGLPCSGLPEALLLV